MQASSLIGDTLRSFNIVLLASLLAFQQSFWSCLETLFMALGSISFLMGDCLLSAITDGEGPRTSLKGDAKVTTGNSRAGRDKDAVDVDAMEGAEKACIEQEQYAKAQRAANGQGLCEILSACLGIAVGAVSLVLCLMWFFCRQMSVWNSKFCITYMAFDPMDSITAKSKNSSVQEDTKSSWWQPENGWWSQKWKKMGFLGRSRIGKGDKMPPQGITWYADVWGWLGLGGMGLVESFRRIEVDASKVHVGGVEMTAFKVGLVRMVSMVDCSLRGLLVEGNVRMTRM